MKLLVVTSKNLKKLPSKTVTFDWTWRLSCESPFVHSREDSWKKSSKLTEVDSSCPTATFLYAHLTRYFRILIGNEQVWSQSSLLHIAMPSFCSVVYKVFSPLVVASVPGDVSIFKVAYHLRGKLGYILVFNVRTTVESLHEPSWTFQAMSLPPSVLVVRLEQWKPCLTSSNQ